MKPFPYIKVPKNMRPHFDSIFDGEYLGSVTNLTLNIHSILDIGANMGAFTWWAKNIWPNAHVTAFEPFENNADIFELNTAALHSVLLHRRAVTFDTDVKLYLNADNEGAHSIDSQLVGNLNKGSVDVRTLNPMLLPYADYVKIDAEGVELEILDCYVMDLHFRPLLISYEYHRAGDEVKLHNLLSSNGYDMLRGMEFNSDRGIRNWRKRDA